MNLRKDHNRYCIAVCLHGEETLAVRACMCIFSIEPRAFEQGKYKKRKIDAHTRYVVPGTGRL